MSNRYLTLTEVCVWLGKKPNERSKETVAKEVRLRIIRAKGKLDRYDPRAFVKPRAPWRFTEVGLKYIFPEFFDRRDAIAKELARRFKEMDDTIKELKVRIETVQNRARACDEALADSIRQLREEVRSKRSSAA